MRNKGFIIVIGVIAVAAIVLYIVFGNITLPSPENKPEAEGEPSASVVINEVMANNGGAFPDEEGNYSDWLELYNPTDESVKLKGWGLSDEAKTAAKWVFPDVEIAAKGYLVVFCSGKATTDGTADFQHTNFKLKAGTDALTLTNSSSEQMDVLTLPQITSNYSIGRSVDKQEWVEFKDPTPGFENSEQGRKAYNVSMDASAIGLTINELQPSNKTTLADTTGAFSDWIEIFNPTEKAIDLTGFGLSDDPNKPLKWKFPEGSSIEKGQYLIVFASGITDPTGELTKGQLHASFQLSTYSEQVLLCNKRGQIIDSVQFSEIGSDAAYGRNKDTGDWELSMKPSPGFENSDEGYAKYQESFAYGQSGLIISEAMLSNSAYLQENDKKYYDWIELYNNSSQSIDLVDYGLSDNAANPTKWRFPSTVIEPGEYLVVLASGSVPGAKKKYLHVNFALSKEGTVIVLSSADRKIIDRFNVGRLQNGMSYGRTNGASLYYTTPTPGEKNGQGFKGLADKPQIKLAAGFYKGNQPVEIDVPGNTIVRYTVDGSVPSEKSKQYSGAIDVSKTTVVRARAFENELLPSETVTSTYMIDNPHSLPIISLSTDPANMYDEETGIYIKGPNAAADSPFKGANFWQEWEKPVHFEFFEADGKLDISQDAAFRIAGQYSRLREQKGFAVFARSEYGPSEFNYPIFSDRAFTSYKSLALRASGQDSTVTKIKDILATSLVDGKTELKVQAYRQCVVYINGEYFGIYDLRDKINKYFFGNYFDVENIENIDYLVGNGTAIKGDNKAYKDMIAFCESHDLSDQQNYDQVASQMEIANYIDFLFGEMYVANTDSGNIKIFRERVEGSKFQWIFYDFCWSFSKYDMDPMLRYTDPKGHGVGKNFSNTLTRSLLQNAGFRAQFLERAAYLMKNVFTPELILARIDELTAEIASEKPRDSERWPEGGNVKNWEANVRHTRKFAQKRPYYVVKSLQDYFHLSDSKVDELFGDLADAPPPE